MRNAWTNAYPWRVHAYSNASDQNEQSVPSGKSTRAMPEMLNLSGPCDVIVMATHGRTGLGRALRGSVADYVIGHMTDAVVLLVRPPNVERA